MHGSERDPATFSYLPRPVGGRRVSDMYRGVTNKKAITEDTA